MTVATQQPVPGHTGIVLLARIAGAGGVPITAASISAVSVVVTDLTQVAAGQAGSVSTYTPSPATVVFDDLQQTAIWTADGPDQRGKDGSWGYNWLFTIPASDLANSGDRFQIDCKLTPASGGEPFVLS
jgi:hypothetical protein